MNKFKICLAVFFASLLACFSLYLSSVETKIILPSESQVFYDKYGQIVFFDLNEEEEYFVKLKSYEDIPEYFVEAILLSEDQNFWQHQGVDYVALARALWQNILPGGVVSGASTIDQQLAKKMLGQEKRELGNKWRKIFWALSVNKKYSKEEIFLAWANRAPFGGNVTGLRSAALIYFDKEAKDLSLAESVFLAAIPHRPSIISQPDDLKIRQEKMLDLMLKKEIINKKQWQMAKREKINFKDKPFAFPHLITFLRQKEISSSELELSISLGLQEKAYYIVKNFLDIFRSFEAYNVAAIAVDNKSGEVLFYIGSADFFDTEIEGQVNILESYRQVGSTLKPFIYLLAFEELEWTAETMLLDEKMEFPSSMGTSFSPKNYDFEYMGEITVKKALGNSRNVPAVFTLSQIGDKRFSSFLENAGVSFLNKDNDAGLSLALGTAEIRLIDLFRLYLTLAREGEMVEICFLPPCEESKPKRLFSQDLAREITNILADNENRLESFGENSALHFDFDLAAKTGTTRNFNDSFAVGYTPDFTLLVWLGNADSANMRELSGSTGAAFIFHDLALLLHDFYPQSQFPSSPARSGQAKTFSDRRLLSPLAGEVFILQSDRNLEQQKIPLITNQVAKFFLDDVFLGEGEKFLYLPSQGRHTVRAEFITGEIVERQFIVK